MAIEEEIRETEKVREIRLRQLAERHGYRLVKSDSTDPGAFDYGTGGSSSQMEPEPVVKTAGHWTSLSELSCALLNARCGALANELKMATSRFRRDRVPDRSEIPRTEPQAPLASRRIVGADSRRLRGSSLCLR